MEDRQPLGQAAPAPAPAPAPQQQHEADTTSDLIAGWLGGAVGILVSNPLEVLKVRLQTEPARVPSNRVGRSSPPAATSTTTTSTTCSSSTSTTSKQPPPANLATLWRSEGIRFLFAGAAGPILGLAFIDSAFFGLYGRVMQQLDQDRQDPSGLSRVFLAGATAGGLCAMLETPIEVVKCRAQVESGTGAKLGSFKIAQMIAKKEGLRGFYVGGLMTAIHDGVSSGIFFWGYFVFRRLLRGEQPFVATASQSSPTATTTSRAIPDAPPPSPAGKTFEDGKMNKGEVGRILLAGGLAGALSAIVPYPFDIIKTRLQTSNFEAKAHAPSPPPSSSSSQPSKPPPIPPKTHITLPPSSLTSTNPLSIRAVALGIHTDGATSYRYRYRSTLIYSFLSNHIFKPKRGAGAKIVDGLPAPNPRAEKWALRVLGMKGFARGIRPTVISSFVGSAVTITTFELALHWLGGDSGVGGAVG